MSWRTVSLGEIASMKYGKLPPKERNATEGFPIFTGYRIAGFCGEYLYDEPEVIVVARGVGGTGDVKMSPEKSWITNLSIVLSVDPQHVDKRFLLYRLGQEPLKDKLNTGAAQSQITIENLQPYPITLPNVTEQRRIASILSSYDDLIENNNRRIALLEQAARLLYEEWFTPPYRFPGSPYYRGVAAPSPVASRHPLPLGEGRGEGPSASREHTRIVGGVPKGWERKCLGDIFEFQYGKALKEDARVLGSYPVYGSSGVVGSHDKALVEGPGIIVGRKGNVGSVHWSPADFWPIDTVYYVPPEHVSLFLLHILATVHFQSSDVAVPGLNRGYAHSMQILWPTDTLRNQFEEFGHPIYGQATALRQMNKKARAARDLLLPRLMSGEVAV